MADTWYKPGTRLKLQYLEATDGATQFSGWFDSMRTEGCVFVQHADGSTRCLPILNPNANAGVFFSDAACSAVLSYRSKAATPAPKYSVAYENNGYRLFPVTAAYAGTVYYQAAPASCQVYPATVTTTYDLFRDRPC